ncbi:hypothetical protein BUALT_Bualt09G0006300 [Buddleja alternifolia]|uniref:peptidylprolyl isomerase n=1 Tax=Buddleja alternifolia TaxID=168488 RepID=A0AAV6WZG4_9LAMI|nr:hypothetical protein BUALT_Bualt09G0006300 [Buddleja alternifolia]
MATMAMASLFRPFLLLQDPLQHVAVGSLPKDIKSCSRALYINYFSGTKFTCLRPLIYCSPSKAGKRLLLKPLSAVGSGLEASITDPKDNLMSIKNVEIVVESKDDEKMQVRVDLPGKETQMVFDKILRNLARTAPPVPGFRREKGGKTTKVPTEFLLQILGEDRVTNFVIQEIVSSTLADYVKEENVSVKDNKINTIQTAEELKSSFIPGNDFGFNATLELLQKSIEEEEEEESTE